MARLIDASDSVAALGRLLSLTLREGHVLSDRVELLSVLVSVGSAENMERTKRFVQRYKEVVGAEFWDRAKQLYCSPEPFRWKVSYRGRLTGTGRESEDNQLRHIVQSLSRTPGANTLSFSFHRPADHRRARVLPASMPCPIAGDFKYRHGQLHLNVFFRTHDAYRLGFPDLFFMRLLQREILNSLLTVAPRRFANTDLGELNLFLSRVFILKHHRNKAEKLLKAVVRFQSAHDQ